MAKLLFERRVIDPILNCIKENLDYLTKTENIPQLAKLGFIYNTLWYMGRLCYGYKYRDFTPLIAAKNQCEDNPKYKLELCDVGTDDQYNLVYDAWGMHVSNEGMSISYDDFVKLITEGKEYSEYDLLCHKPEKTLDEWVELQTHPDFPYRALARDRRSVMDHLLCVIGNGFGYKNGFVIEEASGADQDITLYAGWENAVFAPKIQKVVDKLLADDDVKQVLNKSYEFSILKKKERQQEELNRWKELFELSNEVKGKVFEPGPEFDRLLQEFLDNIKQRREGETEVVEYRPYYPICDYSIITKLDENSHISYLVGAYEICKNILEHPEQETNKYSNNVTYAQANIERFKVLAKL